MKKTLLYTLLLLLAVNATAQKWTHYNPKNSDINGDNILAVAADNRGSLWVGTTQGLNRFKDGVWTDFADFNEKLKDQFVNCLVADGNTLWIGTDDYGVIEFNDDKWYEHAAETRRLNMKYIRDIAIDHTGTKWIGVTLSGLVQYDGYNWYKFTAAESELLSDFILRVVIDNRDRKWVGTNDGLCVYDGRRWISYTTKNSKIPHNICLSLAIDKDNVKWIGTLNGLARYDGENWKIYDTYNCPIPGNQINDLVFDSEGHLWMATDGGVAVFDCNDRWDTFRAGDKLPKCMFQNITIDRKGNIWIGTDEQGLYCLSGYKMPDPAAMADSALLAANTPADNGEGATASEAKGKTGKKRAGLNNDAASEERIRLTPDLEEGTLMISMTSATAEVTFINSKGDKVRTVPKYRNNTKINISKMKKGTYTVRVKTALGTRNVKFTLK